MRKKVLVKGPALSRSGYGEQTRFALRVLRSREDLFDIYLINIPWGQTGFIIADDEERQWLDDILSKTIQYMQTSREFDASLQVTIPNEWEQMAPINIGYTAGIETTKVAPVWIGKGLEMDKIIVVSNHSKQVYETTTCVARNEETGEEKENFRLETPISAVNYPVRHFEPVKMPDVKLKYDFNFLAVAQWGPRKNLGNTIKWFVEEYRNEEVGLVVKCNIANDSLVDQEGTENQLRGLLQSLGERKCKVYLIHGTLTENQMTWLYQHKKIKAMVSLTHGEGFGLPLFEAAYNALPIICPLWSGQADFLYATNKKGKIRPMVAKVAYTMQPVPPEAVWEGVVEKDSMWAVSDEKSYKQQLREVYKNYPRFKSQANLLKKHINKNFAEDDIYQEFIEAFWPDDKWGPLDDAAENFDVESWLQNLDLETHE